MTLTADDHRNYKEAEEFCRQRGIAPGYKFEDKKEGPCVFGRISGTGHLICHPEGEPDMQSSWAWTPEKFAEHVFDKS